MNRLISWLMLLSLGLMWGSGFFFIEIALRDFSPGWIVAGRLILSALVLIVWMLAAKRRIPPWGRVWFFLMIVAVVGNIMPFYLIALGQETIDSGMTGTLMAVMPLVVILLAHFVVPDEPLTWLKTCGFSLGFIGIVFLLGPEVQIQFGGGGGQVLLAQLLVFGGACCYGITVVAVRLQPKTDPLGAAVGAVTLAALVATPIALITSELPNEVEFDSALALLILAVFPSGIATVVYFALIARAGASFLALTNYMVPVVAVMLGVLFLNEQMTSNSLVALGLILLGIVLAQKDWRQEKLGPDIQETRE